MADILGGSNGDKSFTAKRKKRVGRKKNEFIGWGSRPLIEFLEAIGEDVTTKPTRGKVTELVIKYVNDNNLSSPPGKKKKKKIVLCDKRLKALFSMKTISLKRVYNLLEKHFFENLSTSDDESTDNSDEDNLRGKKIKPIVPIIPQTPKSCFASIVSHNIKLLYLKKTVVQEFLKDPDSFNIKVVGSFVRMRTDPNDIFQKNRYQLQLVTGVEMVSEAGTEVRLRVENYFKGVPISMLSDGIFTDDEVVDVSDRIKAGALRRLTVVELESKARLLHADIMKESIAKELSLLQWRIDHANDKGWRKELFEYLERRTLLQTPSEVEKLLVNVPEVIAEELEPDADAILASPSLIQPGTTFIDVMSKESSKEKLQPVAASEEISILLIAQPEEKPKQSVSPIEPDAAILASPSLILKETPDVSSTDVSPLLTSKKVVEIEKSNLIQGTPSRDEESDNLHTLRSPTGDILSEDLVENPRGREYVNELLLGDYVKPPPISVLPLIAQSEEKPTQSVSPNTIAVVSGAFTDIQWKYVDPKSNIQGPFPLSVLKKWREKNYFGSDFAIWKVGQTPEDAVLLSDVLNRQ